MNACTPNHLRAKAFTSGRVTRRGTTQTAAGYRCAPAGGPAVGAVNARLSPDGGFLYVDQSKTGKVAAFLVTGGGLTGLGAFPLPAGAAPAGMVVS